MKKNLILVLLMVFSFANIKLNANTICDCTFTEKSDKSISKTHKILFRDIFNRGGCKSSCEEVLKKIKNGEVKNELRQPELESWDGYIVGKLDTLKE